MGGETGKTQSLERKMEGHDAGRERDVQERARRQAPSESSKQHCRSSCGSPSHCRRTRNDSTGLARLACCSRGSYGSVAARARSASGGQPLTTLKVHERPSVAMRMAFFMGAYFI